MKKKKYEEFVRTRSTIAEDGRKYAALGLAGETGELVTEVIDLSLAVSRTTESVKKFLRNNDKEKYRERIVSEAGDVLFYLTKVLQDVDADLNEVMDENKRKIDERNKNGFTRG